MNQEVFFIQIFQIFQIFHAKNTKVLLLQPYKWEFDL